MLPEYYVGDLKGYTGPGPPAAASTLGGGGGGGGGIAMFILPVLVVAAAIAYTQWPQVKELLGL